MRNISALRWVPPRHEYGDIFGQARRAVVPGTSAFAPMSGRIPVPDTPSRAVRANVCTRPEVVETRWAMRPMATPRRRRRLEIATISWFGCTVRKWGIVSGSGADSGAANTAWPSGVR